MARLLKKPDGKFFYFKCLFDERHLARDIGFIFDQGFKVWKTNKPSLALKLLDYAEGHALEYLLEYQSNLKNSRLADSKINLPRPDGLEYMPFQKVGIVWGSNRNTSFIFDEQGLGKTIQAIGIINNCTNLNKIFITAKKSGLINWKLELEKWLVRKRSIEIFNGKNLRECLASMIVIVPHSRMTQFYSAYPDNLFYDYMVVDEEHFFKNEDAQRTQALYGIYAKSNKPKISFLTGTPIENNPLELWPAIKNTCHEIIGRMSRSNFILKYCGGYYDGYGLVARGSSNEEEMQEILRSTVMIRRFKKEVLDELPDKIYHSIVLESNQKIKKLDGLFDKKLAGKEIELGEHMATGRRLLALEKVPYAIEEIKNLLEENEKIIVFGIHKEAVAKIYEGLKQYNPQLITGDVISITERQKRIDAFMNDKDARVFLGNIDAAGDTITLTSSSTVFFFEFPWTSTKFDQACDRAHRIGQKGVVNIYSLIFENTFDAVHLKKLVEKREMIEETLDEKTKNELGL